MNSRGVRREVAQGRPGDPRCPGAFIDEAGNASFCVWAPQAESVELLLMRSDTWLPLNRGSDGYFELTTDSVPADALYKYRVDGQGPWPDPFSRFQPEGPHGPSQLIAPDRYRWRDEDWPGIRLQGQVIYELHIGTFTREGTFDAARTRLQWLKDLGITLIEVMPVAEFPGRRNWGYDGVQLFAPFHGYGDHEALKRFVDAAHEIGLGVILDVVYNHLGPDGNYLGCYSPYYFTSKHVTEWGEAINFDAEHCRGARDLIVHNATYWIREFHLDGFRLDATQAIFDSSGEHIIAALSAAARTAAEPRSIVIVAENEPQNVRHLMPREQGGFEIDGLWNDDFHHTARVALTGVRDGYYFDYTGRAQELLSAVRHGFLFQGQHYCWQQQRRGTPLRKQPAWACVHFLQNHDQVGNSPGSRRAHGTSDAGRYRALTALLLLGPQTPMLFMGQEFGSSRPFYFFVDHGGELARQVFEGRRKFMEQFVASRSQAAQALVPDPAADGTFDASVLDWSESKSHRDAVQLHRDLLRLRRTDPVIARQDVDRIEGATLSESAFVLRWFDDEHGDRLLVVNLDRELVLSPAPEPLLAPQLDARWEMLWASEHPDYGGRGHCVPVDVAQRWRIPSNSATLLKSVSR